MASQISISADSATAYRFGPYEADLRKCELRKFGIRLRLERKPWQLLVVLLERHGDLVTRGELERSLWGEGVFVDFEHGINVAVKKLRRVLCDSPEEKRYIETVAGEGYRFIAPVEIVAPEPESRPAAPEPEVTPATAQTIPLTVQRRQPWGLAMFIGSVLAAGIAATVFFVGVWGHRAPLLRQPGWVLITDFENRTGNPLLDGTLEYALQRELSNSRFVRVVPRQRIDDVLRLMHRPLDSRIDTSLGREICLRDGGIGALLSGRVEKLGTTYVLSVNVLDRNGVMMASLSEEDPADSQMAATVRRLSNRVRRRLGEEPSLIAQGNERLERVTTPSLQALQLYSQGERLLEHDYLGNMKEAEQFFRRALKSDPQFASALNMLAWCLYYRPGGYDNQPEAQEQRRAEMLAISEKANQLTNTVSEREANFIRGSYYRFRNDWERADTAFRAVLDIYPEDPRSAYEVVMLETGLGHDQDTVQWTRRMADLRPNNPTDQFRAWQTAVQRGENDLAVQYEQRLRGLQAAGAVLPPSIAAKLDWVPILERASEGDVAGALERARALKGPIACVGPAAPMAVYFYASLGMFAEAEKFANNTNLSPYMRAFAMQAITARRGDGGALLSHAITKVRREFPASYLPPSGEAAVWAAIDLAHNGRAREARAATRLYLDYAPFATAIRPKYALYKLIEGDIARDEGRLDEAIPLLQEATEQFRTGGVGVVGDFGDRNLLFWSSESLARALDARGNTTAAIDVLEPLEHDPRFDFVQGSGPTAQRFLLSTLYRKAGRIADAKKVEGELQSFLRFADPDYPLLAALKKQAAQ